jgi:MinD-like ATPase involved in chromosome partitioning or flagellar assembly
MALANFAWLLAMNNKQVLVIDWDLEAPGVHRYFHPFIEDKELQCTRGLMDFVEDLAARAAASPEPLADEEGDVSSYVVSLDRAGWNWEEFGDRAGIDLIPAGQQNAGYSKKLNSFDWISFYTKLGGRRLLSYMISQLKAIYDYILIDSRTGVSDTSGICTVELPDTVVVCFTLNEQSIRGAANVSESIISQHKMLEELRKSEQGNADPGAREFRIYPIPTRIDNSEYDKRQIGISLARKTFSQYLGDVSQDDLSKYWGDFQMPYVPNYAFEEIPAVFGDLPYDQLSISAFIGRLAKVLTGESALRLPALPEERRLEALRWFQRQSETPQDPVQQAEEAFQGLPDKMKVEATQVLLRLVGFTHRGSSSKGLSREELQKGLSEAADALVKARILSSVVGQGGQVLLLSEPTLCEIWPRYAGWIQNDLEFLQWRQSINSAAQSWRLTKSSETSLLSGDPLEDAKGFWRTRANDLNDDERDYISTSIERDEQRRTIEELSRANKEAMERHVALLEKELASKESKTTKGKWYSSSTLILVLAFLLISGIAGAFVISYRQNLANEQQREAALNEQISELKKEQADAESQANALNQSLQRTLASLASSENEQRRAVNGATATNGVSVSNSSAAKPGGSPTPSFEGATSGTSSTNANSSSSSLLCHILPTKSGWKSPGIILVNINGRSVGSFTMNKDGSATGLDFPCQVGVSVGEMTWSGHSPTCPLSLTVGPTFSFTPSFQLLNGGATCGLKPVGPSSAK